MNNEMAEVNQFRLRISNFFRISVFGFRISGPLLLASLKHVNLPAALSLCLTLLFSDATSARSQQPLSRQASRPSTSIASDATAEEHDTDKQNMLAIFKALKSYEKDHGKFPGWLSDLVPKYIQDTNVFVSPLFRRTGKEVLYGNEDPHVMTSYIYEFSAKPVPKAILSAFPTLAPGTTMREWKTRQLAEFGPVVPILRCFLHDPVLNISSDGEFFESGSYWETDPTTMQLRKKRMAAESKTAGKPSSP